MPTELVNCSVATRAKSAAKLLTIRSICILLILGMLSFSSLHARLELGHRVADGLVAGDLQLLLHLADERGVLVEQLAVLGADRRRRPCLRSSWRSSRMLLRLSWSFIRP